MAPSAVGVGAAIEAGWTIPAEAGDYEIRSVLEAPGGRRVLARRTLRVPPANLLATATAAGHHCRGHPPLAGL